MNIQKLLQEVLTIAEDKQVAGVHKSITREFIKTKDKTKFTNILYLDGEYTFDFSTFEECIRLVKILYKD